MIKLNLNNKNKDGLKKDFAWDKDGFWAELN